MSPLEFVARRVTPYIRGLIAIQLVESGFSQPKVASLLGVSQPMISKYLKYGAEGMLRKLKEAGVDEPEALAIAKSLALRLAENKVEALQALAVIEFSLLARGIICSGYVKAARLPEACKVLNVYYETGDPYIAEVEHAYREIASIKGISRLIPEVGSNIVVMRRDARSIAEAVAFPGRIIKMDDSIVAVGRPSYGGSRFMATIVLEASRLWGKHRAAIAVKRDEKLLKTFKNLGLEVCEFTPTRGLERYFEDLRETMEARGRPCDIIDDRGGPGIEPITYILAPSAAEAVSILREAVRIFYSTSAPSKGTSFKGAKLKASEISPLDTPDSSRGP
ncbi:MAG: thiamine-phosphate synthase family protein [Thermoprotei archaeon]|nr:thiamine-phosphate synthase family protein [Thermoprotei archaeon]